MTKDQELAVLDKAIAALGKDTYCGPWLAAVRHEVEQSLRSDLFPDFSVREARVECAAEKKRTEEYCTTLRANAERDAKKMRADAFKSAEDIAVRNVANVKEQLTQAKWALDRLITNLP